MKVGTILLICLGGFFFLFGACFSQVSVVHFNSEWNSENNFDISSLKNCETENIIICNYPDLKEKHNVISVPTIIVFEDNIEIKRFQANIMLELECKLKDIQKEIDFIMLKRFE
jgi:hypothetical protein